MPIEISIIGCYGVFTLTREILMARWARVTHVDGRELDLNEDYILMLSRTVDGDAEFTEAVIGGRDGGVAIRLQEMPSKVLSSFKQVGEQ